MRSERRAVAVYTDGAYRSHEMGWAALIVAGEKYQLVGGYTDKAQASPNRAELEAVIAALAYANPSEIFLFSDSMYVVKNMQQLIAGKVPAKPVAWNRVANLAGRHRMAGVFHVESHSGNLYNEIADQYAKYCLDHKVYELNMRGLLDVLIA